jgi:hypothetical protein
MTTTCTRCESSGFLNLHQAPDGLCDSGVDEVLKWISEETEPHDVQVCDCCGDGTGWHGTPGEHYGPDDPAGAGGPYEGNGGLCHCH